MGSARAAVLAVTFALLLAGCAGGGDSGGTGTTTTTTVSASTSTSTSTSETSTAPRELPGERVEIYPYADAELAVVGVEADDTLNVRSGPGVDFDVVFELEPLATGVVATGHNRSVSDAGFWAEVRASQGTGWANLAFLSHRGATSDITSEVVRDGRPSAPNMRDLGLAVAERRASEDPKSKVVVVAGPTVGDLGEVTVDVIGLGDDSVGGVRLHVFGAPESGGTRFTLRTVEATTLCTRGVSDGLCV